MKTEINKSVKRALSMVIAVALLLGTLFTANVGVNIKADATTGSGKTVVYATSEIHNPEGAWAKVTGTGSESDPFVISSVAQLRYLSQKSTYATTNGKYYTIDPTIGTMVLQSESYINKVFGSLDAFLALSGSEVKDQFTTNTSDLTQYQSGNNSDGFAGYFDFNGVTICGMYNANGGLFSKVKGDVTIKNLKVTNSYVKGSENVGAIFARSFNTADRVTGSVTVQNCAVTDVYIEGTATSATSGYYGVGAIAGQVGNSYSLNEQTENSDLDKNGKIENKDVYYNGQVNVNNCFVNIDRDCLIANCTADNRIIKGGLIGKGGTNQCHFTNCIVLGVTPYATQINTGNNDLQHTAFADRFSNIYTDSEIENVHIGGSANSGIQNYTGKMTKITAEDAKGVTGRLKMTALNWATDSADGDWYAIEGDFPTPIKPDGWTDVDVPSFFTGTAAAAFAGGDGTKADPYLIKTPDQLYKMVTSSGKDAEGNQLYYKVADGVEKLYLNNIYLNESLEGIKALVSGGSYKNWEVQSDFYGNFDGNGVTISGMISTDGTGFVYCLSGNSILENINFENCYVKGSSAAVVTTKVGPWQGEVDDPAISNISVRKSHIESTRTDITLKNNETNGYYYNLPAVLYQPLFQPITILQLLTVSLTVIRANLFKILIQTILTFVQV